MRGLHLRHKTRLSLWYLNQTPSDSDTRFPEHAGTRACELHRFRVPSFRVPKKGANLVWTRLEQPPGPNAIENRQQSRADEGGEPGVNVKTIKQLIGDV